MDKNLDFFKIMKTDTAYAAKYSEDTKDVQMRAKRLVYNFNNTAPDEGEKRNKILNELFGTCSSMMLIEPPFRCDYGFNIHIEGFLLMNYNCCILDTSPVHIGARTFIAPNVVISCAGHAIHPAERSMTEVSKPIFIGEDVWIGANATILGGVHIGSGSVIGAGSVVNKDIPEGVVAAGVPCKVIRKITDEDKLNLEGNMKLL